jgi:hypothetical protein
MEFIFTIILMICLGIVLYLTVQALPRIEEVPEDEKGFFERWTHSEMPEKIDAAFNNFRSISKRSGRMTTSVRSLILRRLAGKGIRKSPKIKT